MPGSCDRRTRLPKSPRSIQPKRCGCRARSRSSPPPTSRRTVSGRFRPGLPNAVRSIPTGTARSWPIRPIFRSRAAASAMSAIRSPWSWPAIPRRWRTPSRRSRSVTIRAAQSFAPRRQVPRMLLLFGNNVLQTSVLIGKRAILKRRRPAWPGPMPSSRSRWSTTASRAASWSPARRSRPMMRDPGATKSGSAARACTSCATTSRRAWASRTPRCA